MHKSKFMEKLLDGVEVEWKKLGEVAEIKRGQRVTKNNLSPNKKYPVYSGGITPMGYFDGFNNDANTITIVKYGTAGFVNFITEKFWANDVSYCVKPNKQLNNKFLFYFLKNKQDYIQSLATNAIPAHLPTDVINNILIPIPLLEAQRKIVEILDNFTELTAELTAELSARKKQYNYYRDKLLTFEDDEVEWKKLGDVAIKISSGGTPKTSVAEYYNGDIPWLRTQEVNFREIWDTDKKITEKGLKNSSAKIIPKNCVIIAMYGATVGKVAINKIEMATNQACANIQLNENKAHYRYIFYYLSSQYKYIKSLGTGSQTNINANIVRNLQIPIPPLEKQKEIVEILDKFDTLTNSISEGLPKEIELRQKQYEYYRDMLLSFPKENTNE